MAIIAEMWGLQKRGAPPALPGLPPPLALCRLEPVCYVPNFSDAAGCSKWYDFDNTQTGPVGDPGECVRLFTQPGDDPPEPADARRRTSWSSPPSLGIVRRVWSIRWTERT